MIRSIARLLLTMSIVAAAAAQGQVGEEALAEVARRTLATYADADRATYLDNLFRLQLAAGRLTDAQQTMAELRALRARTPGGVSPLSTIAYEIDAEARLRETRDQVPSGEALAGAFRSIIGALDARFVANEVRWIFGTSLVGLERDAAAVAAKHPDPAKLAGADAIDWVRKMLGVRVFGRLLPIADALLEEDDQRRYIIEKDILVATPNGGRVCALVVRPRNAPARLTALLNFTIYSGDILPMAEARRTASHGYVGVEGFTRGKACSPDAPVPIEHDGADAAAVIDWIARQP